MGGARGPGRRAGIALVLGVLVALLAWWGVEQGSCLAASALRPGAGPDDIADLCRRLRSAGRWLLSAAALAAAGAALGWAWLRWVRRRPAARLAATAAAIALCCIVDAVRLDAPAFDRAAARAQERARSLAERATRFDGDAALAATPPAYGRVLRLDDLEAELERVEGTGEPASGDPFDSLGLDFEEGDPWGLRSADPADRVQLGDGALRGACRPGLLLESDRALEIPLDDLGALEIELDGRAGAVEIGWSSRPDARAEDWDDSTIVRRVRISTDGGRERRRYRIPGTALQVAPGAEAVARRLFVDPCSGPGDPAGFELDALALRSRLHAYRTRGTGRTLERLGGELRAGVFVVAPARLRYRLTLPDGAPRLELALGVLPTDEPVRLSVEVGGAGSPDGSIEHTVAVGASGWSERRLDLSPWAGRTVDLVLAAESANPAVAVFAHPTVVAAIEDPVQVLWIVDDTQRADHLSLHGYARPTSPFKERFFGEGAVFLRAYGQATKTRPSVPSYMTSLLPLATGVTSHFDRLDERYVTLAEVLRAQGFATASFVQNGNAGPAAGLAQGFDVVRDARTLGGRPRELFDGGPFEWLAARSDRNRFAYLHVLDPHGVYDPPAPWDRWWRELEPGGEAVRFDRVLDPPSDPRPTHASRVARYDGEIRNDDEALAGFLARLEEAGLLDRTLVLYSSDHGEHMGEAGLWEHRPPGLPGVLHVPLALRWPGRVPAGLRIEEPVALLDVVPTVLDLLGIDSSALLLGGDSLVPLLAGEPSTADGEPWAERIVLSQEVVNRAPWIEGEWGSAFFRSSQLINSREFLRLSKLAEERLGRGDWHEAALGLRVLDLTGPRPSRRLGLGLDPFVRRRFRRLVGSVQEASSELHAALVAGKEPGTVDVDLEAQAQLRALGYIE